MHINYTRFCEEELDTIKKEFNDFGFNVSDADEFSTYRGWMQKGRKVKRGEKGLKIETNHLYAKPLFHYGAPVIDKKTGKQKFYKGTQRFVLFAIQQTEELSVA